MSSLRSDTREPGRSKINKNKREKMTVHYHRKSPLEISELAEFDKNIEDDTEEIRRCKRIAYLEQALVQAGYGKSLFKVMGCMFIPFAIIPVFWPVLLFAWFISKKSRSMVDSQINSALAYWNIDRFDLDSLK